MADRGLKAGERLKKRKEIDRVFSEGVRLRGGVLRAVAAPNGLQHSRIGVGASVKMCNAVKRNRLKRLAREAFRLNKENIPKGFDIFVTHTKVDATFADVQSSLLKIGAKLEETS